MKDTLIKVDDLHVSFKSFLGTIDAVRGVSFSIDKGSTLGLVGESGSGKSLTGLAIMGLIPKPNGYIKSGDIQFKEVSLYQSSNDFLPNIRGKEISMIFQEPMTSLNPVFKIGEQIGEALEIHKGIKGKKNKDEVIDLLKSVQIPSPEKIIDAYPHQLSGGMRQRVMIAIAISCQPDLIIADEPTTALDVTIQAQILRQMKHLVKKFKVSLLFISHDLGVVQEMADNVAVMYCGKIVEFGSKEKVLKQPLHPYTVSLIKARPENYDPATGYYAISGMVPSLLALPKGCSFAERCPECMAKCKISPPLETDIDQNHRVSCWKYEGAKHE